MTPDDPTPIKGRAAQTNPPNRFERLHVEADLDHASPDDLAPAVRTVPTQYYLDDSQSLVSENHSPDIPFQYSINPYRGCAHGCSYCYARPTHEYLGMSAGLDFESKILVKQRAPELLREHLAQSHWAGQPIMVSGVTDCYQPAERSFRLTRQCLEVAWEARQPLGLITKNALVTRDLDLLATMARHRLVHVAVSLTTLDQTLTRVLEPRTSSPQARLRAIRELADAGVPTHVMLAPIIPGLTDAEIPALLEAAREHGAQSAAYILLRLPLTVKPVFLEWLERHFPDQRAKVEGSIRSVRDGALNSTTFGERMRGSGVLADSIAQTFRVFARRYGLDNRGWSLDTSQFRHPTTRGGQGWLV